MLKNPTKILFFLSILFLSNNAFCFNYKPIHEFEIYRNNKKIGFHKLTFENFENKIIINTEINIVVKLGILPIFTYFHENEETWEDNKFVKAITNTKKNKREFKLKAERQGSKIKIKSRGKTFFINDDDLITSYWHQNWFEKEILYDSQHGKKRLIKVEKKDYEKIKTSTGKIFAQKYKVTGFQDKPNGKKIDYEIWYDDEKRWVKIKFFIKKSLIEYYLVTKY